MEMKGTEIIISTDSKKKPDMFNRIRHRLKFVRLKIKNVNVRVLYFLIIHGLVVRPLFGIRN